MCVLLGGVSGHRLPTLAQGGESRSVDLSGLLISVLGEAIASPVPGEPVPSSDL